MNAVIKTYQLTKRYGKQNAVKHLNLSVRQGEIYGFLGRNGAGKTTTIRMLMGLVNPTGGKIEILGQDLEKQKKTILPRIGSIIEFPGFYRNLTAKENLAINARLLGVQKKSAIEEALETVHLHNVANKVVGKYSLGMKQRLGIARAILHNPEILILDEPTNGLDPVGIKEVRRLIKSLSEERNITVFVSSHILSEVEQLADRIGIIHEGQLLEEISLHELDRLNRRYLEVQVSNASKATMILETACSINDYEVHEDNNIRIYSNLDEAEVINTTFVNNDIGVSKLVLSEDNLEDYFVKITGGGRIA